ncbi:MAG: helix-turn-helix transcriptional regulator [Arachidicoccus sp.]|nr:helix-turn-helix transcriptional regulator [Arachidicoccus sp.]
MALDDFFKPMKLTNKPNAEEYFAVQPYIDAVRVISHATYQSVYIIDYYKQSFVYVSDNPLFLCGNTASHVQKMGYLFYYNYVPKEDLELLLEINQAGFAFYNELPIEERLDYIISYDFRIKQPNNHLMLINHKLVPYILDKSSNIWLALCIVSTSSNDTPGNIIIQKLNSNRVFQYDTVKKLWKLQPGVKLTSIEKEVLLLSSQGLTMKDIAEKMYLSLTTIKFHRIKIFEKLRVKNIGEAIACAANYKLI